MSLPTTTDAGFARDVLAADLPVLVDFTADWCPPCKMIKPVLERIATEEAGRLRVVTLDVDENPVVTGRYGVMGMPPLGLFIGGVRVTTLVGARPQVAILKALEFYLPVSAR
jgi:thioredoxin 1